MFVLPELPYDYSALTPYIDEETMHLHHDKHHATYVQKLNEALTGLDELLRMEINDLLKDLDKVPEDLRTKVRNHGGGHANHSLFWEIMVPNGGSAPKEKVLSAINEEFGDFSSFKDKFTKTALDRFGSGWAWLVVDGKKLKIIDTPNQDSPVMDGKIPILGLDVWEHAYYLNYKNMRADYIAAWWNVINWEKVEELFGKAGDK